MKVQIFDVEHGACAIITGPNGGVAMIDCGHNSTTGFRPSDYIRNTLSRSYLDYLLITNADQDHLSDLATLINSGIVIPNLLSNTNVLPEQLRAIKRLSGPITTDAEAYLKMRREYGAPGTARPFHEGMGGVTISAFSHPYPQFIDTNNLSCVFFITYCGFKIMFPGDLESAGWLDHMKNPAFLNELVGTTVLFASHHGRENGFCEEAFEYLRPRVVVISDKSIMYESQEMVTRYRRVICGDGVILTNDGGKDRRHVLTTRCDGDITFDVYANGHYNVTVEKGFDDLYSGLLSGLGRYPGIPLA